MQLCAQKDANRMANSRELDIHTPGNIVERTSAVRPTHMHYVCHLQFNNKQSMIIQMRIERKSINANKACLIL